MSRLDLAPGRAGAPPRMIPPRPCDGPPPPRGSPQNPAIFRALPPCRQVVRRSRLCAIVPHRSASLPPGCCGAGFPGFRGVPKGFSGIKHRHNERELATMRLTIERAALLKALGHVQSVVERRNTIPILSNVLLSADRDVVSFSATDLDLEITDESAAGVDGLGQITAPAHTLYEIVRKLPEGADVTMAFTGEDPRLTVQAGRSRFNLPVLPAGDFPVMSAEGLSRRITIDTTDLIRLIDR